MAEGQFRGEGHPQPVYVKIRRTRRAAKPFLQRLSDKRGGPGDLGVRGGEFEVSLIFWGLRVGACGDPDRRESEGLTQLFREAAPKVKGDGEAPGPVIRGQEES